MSEIQSPAFCTHHRSAWLLALLIIVATTALYWPATGFDYINFDDYLYVAENPMVSGGLTWEGVQQAFTTVHEQWWLPALWISYMVDIELFGVGPHGHHLINILLHAANAGLLFWVLFRMTGSRGRSAFVAALFAWYPTQVEAVAWIAARKDVLSGLFFMLALLAYVRHAERPSARGMMWVFALMLLGLMSKAIVIVLPPILLLLDYWPLGRAKKLWGAGAWQEWAPLLLEKAALIGLAAVFMGVNLCTHTTGRGEGDPVSAVVRLGMIAPNYMEYVEKILMPIRLNIIYPEHDRISWPYSIAATLVLLGATWAILLRREKRPYWPVGWLWFLIALLPIIRGVRLGMAQVTDRWTYLPLIGLGIAAAWTGAEERLGGIRVRRWACGLGALVLVACLVRTHGHLPWWRNSLVMFQRAEYLEPESHFARNCLGLALMEAGQVEAGAVQFEQAVRLRPAHPNYLSNLGVALLQLGRAEESLTLQEDALRLKPDEANYHNSRGMALSALGRGDEAQAAFEEALRLQPAHPEAHYNLGKLLYERGQPEEALPHFQMAVQGRPGTAPMWYNLGIDYAQLGRYADAESCVMKALQLNPEMQKAKATLAQLQLLKF